MQSFEIKNTYEISSVDAVFQVHAKLAMTCCLQEELDRRWRYMDLLCYQVFDVLWLVDRMVKIGVCLT